MEYRAFTLIEMLIVIILIGIIGSISLRYIGTGNFSKQQSAGVECGMYLTNEIEDFVDNARKNSGIVTKVTTNNGKKKFKKINPDKYIITLNNGKASSLQFEYFSGNQKLIFKKNLLNHHECTSSKYKQKLLFPGNIKNRSGPISLEMNKGFWGDKLGEIATFKLLQGNNGTTIISNTENDIILQSCKNNFCIDAYKFIIDIATQKIKSSICRSYIIEEDKTKNKCKKRR